MGTRNSHFPFSYDTGAVFGALDDAKKGFCKERPPPSEGEGGSDAAGDGVPGSMVDF